MMRVPVAAEATEQEVDLGIADARWAKMPRLGEQYELNLLIPK